MATTKTKFNGHFRIAAMGKTRVNLTTAAAISSGKGHARGDANADPRSATSVHLDKFPDGEEVIDLGGEIPPQGHCISFFSRSDRHWKHLAQMWGACVAINVLISIFTGMYLNKYLCGNAWSCPYIPQHLGASHEEPVRPNYLITPLLSSAVALTLTATHFLIHNWFHNRVSGVFKFSIFCILGGIIIAHTYDGTYTAATLSSSAQISLTLRKILDNTLNYADSPIAMTWSDIVSAGGYYNWLRGPMRDLLFSGDANAGCGVKAREKPTPSMRSLAPTICTTQKTGAPGGPTPASAAGKYQVLWLTGCFQRQLRVKPLPAEATHKVAGLVDTYLPSFTEENMDSSLRSWYNGTVKEEWNPNYYHNVYRLKKPTPHWFGSSLVGARYPGQEGQVFGGDYAGWWYGINNPVPNGTRYDKWIDMMEAGWWIDERTRLVQMMCRGINANSGQRFMAVYSLEITPTGLVYPNMPEISTEFQHRHILEVSETVHMLLVFFFYYLNEEIYEIGFNGWRQRGLVNILELAGLFATYCAYFLLGLMTAGKPSIFGEYFGTGHHRSGIWAQFDAQDKFQKALAVCLMLMCFKSLKFTKNIPIMSTIGNTFGRAAYGLIMFFFVMMVLFVAFSFVFHITLSNHMEEYGTFAMTMNEIILNGLLGNMDYNRIKQMSPTFGTTFYALYLFSAIFVGFTIVISIIADAYEECKDQCVREGFFDSARYIAHERYPDLFQNDAETDENQTPEMSAIQELTTLVQALHQKIDHLEHNQNHNGSAQRVRTRSPRQPTVVPMPSPVGPPTMQDVVRI